MIRAAYVHVPFCRYLCHYCDFTKMYYQKELADQYINTLKMEIQRKKQQVDYGPLKTLYIGGGTPSALTPDQLTKLFSLLREQFTLESGAEFTVEANPDDFSDEKIRVFHEYGVNRVSLGVQSFEENLLEQLGRKHTKQDIYRSIDFLRKIGISNISLDLMAGLPGQTLKSFETSVDEALSFNLPHYSTYLLQIEPKTIFYLKYKEGKLSKPPEDLEVDMYHLLVSKMKEHGMDQYEISNFSKKGFESKHNLTYWNNGYYFGFGPGAHGYHPGKRIVNMRPVNHYIKSEGEAVLEEIPISRNEQIEEEMFLGLRKNQGVSLTKFKKKFGEDATVLFHQPISKLQNRGLLELEEGFLRLTETGRLISNEVFLEFLLS
ncbi:radical SAM family heme chaperone HemW [Bacillaceae bacterium S4-13-56]